KFNRRHGDDFNNARVELACLHMARDAGLRVSGGRIVPGINGREVLLLKRFDLITPGERHHLITVNGLLKNPMNQRDTGHLFRYDDVHELLQRYSVSIAEDLTQLATLMLFNSAINNTDDHERNFSLIHRGDGYRLAPAYDMVPSLVTGAYHAAGFGWHPDPPRPSETRGLGRLFGLAKGEVSDIADRVQGVVKHWQEYAEAVGVSDRDYGRIAPFLGSGPDGT
ncbi:MAG: HipA domain-containing protein, partial [Chromatocurvus sp.]